MAALRRMDAPSYGGDWQAEPYGYPPSYGGGQTLPPPASGGGGGMGGGGGTLGRSKGKIMSGGGPGGPNPKGQSKGGGPKVNGNNSSGQGGWWPECTCTNREWYDQVTYHLYSVKELRPVGGPHQLSCNKTDHFISAETVAAVGKRHYRLYLSQAQLLTVVLLEAEDALGPLHTH